MQAENLCRLGIITWEPKDFERDESCEIHITKDGRLVVVEENDLFRQYKYKATLEILTNNLSVINRTPLLKRKLKADRVTFNDIKILAQCVVNEREKLIDQIILNPNNVTLTDIPSAIGEALETRQIIDRDSEFDIGQLYVMVRNIDRASHTDLSDLLLPEIKARTYKCLMLENVNLSFDQLEDKFIERLRLLDQQTNTDKDLIEKTSHISTLHGFRQCWKAIGVEAWDRTLIDTTTRIQQKSTKAQGDLADMYAANSLFRSVLAQSKDNPDPEAQYPSKPEAGRAAEPEEQHLRSNLLPQDVREKELSTREAEPLTTAFEDADQSGGACAMSSLRVADIPLPDSDSVMPRPPAYRKPPSYPAVQDSALLQAGSSTHAYTRPEVNTGSRKPMITIPAGDASSEESHHDTLITSQQGQGARQKISSHVQPHQVQGQLTDVYDQKSLDRFLIETCWKNIDDCELRRDRLMEMIYDESPTAEVVENAWNAVKGNFWSATYLFHELEYLGSKDERFKALHEKLLADNAFEKGLGPYNMKSGTLYCDVIEHENTTPTYVLKEGETPSDFVDNAEKGPYPLLISPVQHLELQLYKVVHHIFGDVLFDYWFSYGGRARIRLSPEKEVFDTYKHLCKLMDFTTFLPKITRPGVGYITVWRCPNSKKTKFVDKYHTIFAVCTDPKKKLYCIPGVIKDISPLGIENMLASTLNSQTKTIEELHRLGGGWAKEDTFYLDYGKIKKLRNLCEEAYFEQTKTRQTQPEVVSTPRQRVRPKKKAVVYPELKSDGRPEHEVTVETQKKSESDKKEEAIKQAIAAVKQQTKKYKKTGGENVETLNAAIKMLEKYNEELETTMDISDDKKNELKRQIKPTLASASKAKEEKEK